jgi:hypothetical protein
MVLRGNAKPSPFILRGLAPEFARYGLEVSEAGRGGWRVITARLFAERAG